MVGALLVVVVEAVELGDDHPGRQAQAEDEQLPLAGDGVPARGLVEDERGGEEAAVSPTRSAMTSIRRTSQPRRMRTPLARRCSRISSVRASSESGTSDVLEPAYGSSVVIYVVPPSGIRTTP